VMKRWTAFIFLNQFSEMRISKRHFITGPGQYAAILFLKHYDDKRLKRNRIDMSL